MTSILNYFIAMFQLGNDVNILLINIDTFQCLKARIFRKPSPPYILNTVQMFIGTSIFDVLVISGYNNIPVLAHNFQVFGTYILRQADVQSDHSIVVYQMRVESFSVPFLSKMNRYFNDQVVAFWQKITD